MIKAARASALIMVFAAPSVHGDGAIDLTPLPASEWTAAHAKHLASRAGFGAAPREVERLTRMGPKRAVRAFIRAEPDADRFEHSGVFEPALDPFPPSRPAATELAARQGHALGVRVRPDGNRPMQGVVNKFFYWLRASRLETDRVAYWWANRMLEGDYPLGEKMALFWHGHFATNEDKVRDYRKMLKQIQLFRTMGLGEFGDLLKAVARDPAMLVFLDAGVNTKDSPNENFAREIMELFTMGVGHYGEADVREAARAFTGWNVDQMKFVIVEEDHDSGEKQFLEQRGAFDGDDVIEIILAQEATGRFLAAKLYRYFVNQTLTETAEAQLGQLLMALNYDTGRFLQTLFASRDFYAQRNRGTRIKGPIELMISTYRLLDQPDVPGVPDLNLTSAALGQRLMHPPTVAGWSRGAAWITPSLLFERSNFVLDVLFPDIGFVAPDRFPITPEVVHVQNRLREGMSVSQATRPTGVAADGMMAASNLLADRDEAFNTRLGSMRGWQMAIERVRPISRHTARVDLTELVKREGITTTAGVIDFFCERFFIVSPSPESRRSMVDYLNRELGTERMDEALSFAEEPLRKLLHQLMSLPEYQLG